MISALCRSTVQGLFEAMSNSFSSPSVNHVRGDENYETLRTRFCHAGLVR